MSRDEPREEYTVRFGQGDPSQVGLLGGKGAGLAEMAQADLPVPPGFVIVTNACRTYLETDEVPDGLHDEVDRLVGSLEHDTGKTFGRGPHPLLLSVRSGAPVSMPGMMDTILDLGLSREAAVAFGEETGDTRFVADLVRRFNTMYGATVLNALDAPAGVEELVAKVGTDDDAGVVYDRIWDACDAAYDEELGVTVSREPRDQLVGAIEAVFRSWNTRRARTYREYHHIPHTMGTAVVVQTMVFGNLGDDSGSGVVFTRNPVTGEDQWYGEFLANSQGEDVVSGEFTPDPIDQASTHLPEPFQQLREICSRLEGQRHDVLDIEFTVERGRLFLLQVRSAKRTAEAAVRFAADSLEAGVPVDQALSGVTVGQVRQIQRPTFDEDQVELARTDGRLLTTGTGASPGQVSGELIFDSDEAQQRGEEGASVVLVRPVTSPADLHGMIAARGIITGTGGATSHAAVVARALGRPCVVGCSEAEIDSRAGVLKVGDVELHSGDEVSMDGGRGEVYRGVIAVSDDGGSHAQLTTLVSTLRDRYPSEILARVTSKEHVDEARAAGADGLVTALDDVLAASGHLGGMVAGILDDGGGLDLGQVEDRIAEELAPLLAGAEGLEMDVRAVDFAADESNEFLRQAELFELRPELALPLGWPELLETQLAGLARAQVASGHQGVTRFAVRHLNDAREAELLHAIGDRVKERVEGSSVEAGTYATTPRAILHADELVRGGAYWVDLKTLQAAIHGFPARLFLTPQPLDDYLKDGRLGTDPRLELESTVVEFLGRLADDTGLPDGAVGIRLSLPVSPALVAQLSGLGFRRFAVELNEVRPLVLALAQALAQAQAQR